MFSAKIHKDLGGGWYRTTTAWFTEKSTHLHFKDRIIPVLECANHTEQSKGLTITVNKVRINDKPEYLEDFKIDR